MKRVKKFFLDIFTRLTKLIRVCLTALIIFLVLSIAIVIFSYGEVKIFNCTKDFQSNLVECSHDTYWLGVIKTRTSGKISDIEQAILKEKICTIPNPAYGSSSNYGNTTDRYIDVTCYEMILVQNGSNYQTENSFQIPEAVEGINNLIMGSVDAFSQKPSVRTDVISNVLSYWLTFTTIAIILTPFIILFGRNSR